MATAVMGEKCFFPWWNDGFFLLTECLLPSMTFSGQKNPWPQIAAEVCGGHQSKEAPLSTWSSADPVAQQVLLTHSYGHCWVALLCLLNHVSLRLTSNFQSLRPHLALVGGGRTDTFLNSQKVLS